VPGFALSEQNAAAVAQICRQLDGIPLAIELAAARLKLLTVEQIAARLEDRFRLLTGGSRTALARHQTLRATMDWSYDLLSEPEQALLRRLSVFAGGFTLEEAEAACSDCGLRIADCGSGKDPSAIRNPPSTIRNEEGLDLLGQLVDKSLVLVEEGGETVRYRLLETVRQYARERLRERGEERVGRQQHLRYFLKLAEEGAPELEGPHQGRWLARLEQEHDNLRAALACSLEQEDGDMTLRLAGALSRFWLVRGHESEGREWLRKALAAGANGAPLARAKALTVAGELALWPGDYQDSQELAEAGLALYRELQDRSGIASALNLLALVAFYQNDYPRARALFEQALGISREIGHRVREANALNGLGMVTGIQGDYAAAWALCEASLAIQRELGDSRGIAGTLNLLGQLAESQGDYPTAQARFEEALAINRAVGNRKWEALNLNTLGEVALRQGEYPAARALCEECLVILRELDSKRIMADALGTLAEVALQQEEYPAAQRYVEESLLIRRASGHRRGIAASLEVGAWLAWAQGESRRAARLYAAAESLREALGAPLAPHRRQVYASWLAEAREALGDAAFSVAQCEGRAMSLDEIIAGVLEGEKG
jgi:tetratricopeptide (TPR) repeat protein